MLHLAKIEYELEFRTFVAANQTCSLPSQQGTETCSTNLHSFDLDSENLWEEFKRWCLEHDICNNAWLRKHEQFAFRKHASKQ